MLTLPLYGLPEIDGPSSRTEKGWFCRLNDGWTYVYDLDSPNKNFQERRRELVMQFRAICYNEERTVNAWRNTGSTARNGKVEPQNQWVRNMSLRFALVPCRLITKDEQLQYFRNSCLASGYKGALFIPFDHLPYII